jgi:ring-1,2-phenylacetyl-CoA epoxidase subunit PaaC
VVRLGDGTQLSHERMQAALEVAWPLVAELFDRQASDLAAVERAEFDVVVDAVVATAGLIRPDRAPLAKVRGQAGRDGVHTEALGHVLAELQSVARAHPDATW